MRNFHAGNWAVRLALGGWAALAAWIQLAPYAAVPMSREGRLALRAGDDCPALASSACGAQKPGVGCNAIYNCSLGGQTCANATMSGASCGPITADVKSYQPPQCVAAGASHECTQTEGTEVNCTDEAACVCIVTTDQYGNIISRGCGYFKRSTTTTPTGYCASN